MAISLYGLQSTEWTGYPLRLLWLLEHLWCWNLFLTVSCHVTSAPSWSRSSPYPPHSSSPSPSSTGTTQRLCMHSWLLYSTILSVSVPRCQVPGTQISVSNLFCPRYRRATKKSTVLDHWGKKVHFLVNMIDLKSSSSSSQVPQKSCIQVLLKFFSGPWEVVLKYPKYPKNDVFKFYLSSTQGPENWVVFKLDSSSSQFLLKFYSGPWKFSCI